MKTEGYPAPITLGELNTSIEKAMVSAEILKAMTYRWRQELGETTAAYLEDTIFISVLKPKSQGALSLAQLESAFLPVVEFARRHGYRIRPKVVSKMTIPAGIEIPISTVLESMGSQFEVLKKILSAANRVSTGFAHKLLTHPSVRSLKLSKLESFLSLLLFYEGLLRLREQAGGRLELRPRSLTVDGYDTKYFEQNETRLEQLFSFDVDRNTAGDSLLEYLGVRQNDQRVRMRHLDPELALKKGSIFAPYGDIEVSLEVAAKEFEIGAFDTLIIVENLLSYQEMPQVEGVLAIWGGGFKVLGVLQKLNIRDKQIRYWGDLDYAGFEILAKVRKIAPQTRSLLMDASVIQRYRHTPTEDYSYKGKESAGWEIELTTAEKDAFYQLNGKRIEQEYVHYMLSSDLF